MSASLMPPWAHPFVAREDIMAEMAAWVQRCRDHRVPCLMYVHGLEGLGVSCLVTQFSKNYHRLIDWPLIWLTGRRTDGTAVPIRELLTRALRQFGIPEDDRGTTEEHKADTLRAVCRSKKFMLVVDDMDSPGQLTALIPDDAPHAIIVATSAFRRGSLEDHGFEPFTPDVLPPDDAGTLFRTELREAVAVIEAPVIERMVTLCGGVPLLLKVLAAQTRRRSARAHRLLGQLQDSRLSVLALDDERRITRFLDTTYRNLADETAAAYRRLGLLPTTRFSVEAAAAALGIDDDTAYPLLEALLDLHLLTDSPPDHYAFHPVLREDARMRATEEDSVRDRVIEQWATWYAREALPRGAAISGRWWVAPVEELMRHHHPHGVPEFRREEALAWFDLEADNVIAAIRAAHQAQLHELAWPLCIALWKYLHLHGLHDVWIDTHQLGLASAEAVDSDLGRLQLLSQLGAGHLELREFTEAHNCFTRSLELARRAQHTLGEHSALEWLGKTAAARGDHTTALDLYGQSWEVIAGATRIDPAQRARILALLNLHRARARCSLGNHAEAATDASAALSHFDPRIETDNNAKSHQILGHAYLGLGRTADAITELRTALEQFSTERLRKHRADTQRLLGDAHLAAGLVNDAATYYHDALDYYRSVNSPQAEVTAAQLDTIRRPDR